MSNDTGVYTLSTGQPVREPYAVGRAGKNGSLLLNDTHHLEALASFDRERIPERVVHAKGSGAHGVFTVTHDITDLTSAALFNKIGNKATSSARFSTVGGESGSADTARDPRGFSIKLRTEEGNWDHVYNNTPVFFLRDPVKFPAFIHTQKRDPQTNLKDNDAFWDYLSQNPEAFHQVMILFGDRGIPDGYRHMHGYSGHTHKLINAAGEFVYAQFHWRSDQGIKFLTAEKAGELAGSNPDYAQQDLFEAIDAGNFPSWTLCVQTMTVAQAEEFKYNILDLTKIWPHGQFPLRPVGKLVLNANVQNYFAEIEQIAFSPSHLIPGIEGSADPVLQSRMFSYPDTQRYRLGVNYNQLPVNAPLIAPANFQRGGAGLFVSQGPRANYQSSLKPIQYKGPVYTTDAHEQFLGGAILELSKVTAVDFEQPAVLWERIYDAGAQERFVQNVAGHLGGAKSVEVKNRTLAVFACISQDLSDRLAKAMGMTPVAPLKLAPASEFVRFSANMTKA